MKKGIPLFIFVVIILTDVAYVFYVRRVTGGRSVSAALISSFITLLGAVLVISYTVNKLYIVPLVLGSFVGTYIAVSLDTRVLLRGGYFGGLRKFFHRIRRRRRSHFAKLTRIPKSQNKSSPVL